MPVEDAPQFRNAGGANGSENSPPTNMIRDRSDLPRRFHSSCHERDVEFDATCLCHSTKEQRDCYW